MASSRVSIKGRRYFSGVCYRCSEVGHMAMYCTSDIHTYLVKIDPSYRKPNKLSKKMYSEKEVDREFGRRVKLRNWAGLPADILSIIFKKITSVDIIRSVQYVCRPWQQLSYEPELWRRILVTMPDRRMEMCALESLAMFAVDRSEGCLEYFYLKDFASLNDELLGYMSDRTIKLRCLRLISIYKMSERALAQAINKFSLLEELEISFCFFSSRLVREVGPACLHLKSFKLNARPYKHHCKYDGYEDFNEEAFSIAEYMQQLQHLQLIGNSLTKTGLLAIINSCPNLQSLDIRACLNVYFDEKMKRKCAKIKNLRPPSDSTADFEFNAFIGDLTMFDFKMYDDEKFFYMSDDDSD